MKMLKRHLSVANVLSLTAIFIALAGSAYAATKLGPGQVKSVNLANLSVTNPKLASQSVTSGKIKNSGINSADLGKESVINSKLKKNAVTNAKLGLESVWNRNLAKKAVTETKLAAEAVTNGKLKSEAVSAAKISTSTWNQLLKNVTYLSETSVSDASDTKSVTAFCPVGKEVLGGGVRLNGASAKVIPVESSPNATGHLGWTASAREIEGGTLEAWSVTAFAVCAEL